MSLVSCASRKESELAFWYRNWELSNPALLSMYNAGQVGLASWYGPKFHGRKTSSGEIYNMYDYTAAHRTLPLGTYVRVENLKNGKWVIVKINDRGPYVYGRIIDLSYAAAKKIGAVEEGVVPVKITVLGRTKPHNFYGDSENKFYVQIGAFISKERAYRLKEKIKKRKINVVIKKRKTKGKTFYRVLVGPYESRSEAVSTLKILRKLGVNGKVILE